MERKLLQKFLNFKIIHLLVLQLLSQRYSLQLVFQINIQMAIAIHVMIELTNALHVHMMRVLNFK